MGCGSERCERAPHIVDRTGRRNLPVGSEDFEEIIRRCVYVDKSMFISDLIDSRAPGTTLFCRPRRFGKSTAVHMLQSFLEEPVEGFVPDGTGLFEGLAVTGDDWAMEELGRHPVIHLNLASRTSGSYEETITRIARAVAREYERHAYLLDTKLLLPQRRAIFDSILSAKPAMADLEDSLSWLSYLLASHHGSKTVILIDEYDAPILHGYLNGYRERIVSFYRNWLTEALKGTRNLLMGMLTGVLRVSAESIFSEFNNVETYSMLDEEFSDAFGFTEGEVEALAAHVGREDLVDDMRDWYDGYKSGGTDVYNPLSVLNCLKRGSTQPYWVDTSDNAFVGDLMAHAGGETGKELLTVATEGEVVEQTLDLRTVFADLSGPRGADALWSQLYLSGYLTSDDTGNSNQVRISRRLRVPNLEVRDVFVAELIDRVILRGHKQERLGALFEAVLGDDAAALRDAIRAITLDSPSFLDLTDEGQCHMLLLALLYGLPDYRPPVSNRESGDGRSDILIEPEPARSLDLPVIAIEVKRPRKEKGDLTDAELEKRATDDALAQAVRLNYGHGYVGRGVIRWGVAFAGKRVACAREMP